jgi:hypothetical protein
VVIREEGVDNCGAMDMDVEVAAVVGTTGVPVAAVGVGGGIPTLRSWYCPFSVLTRR